MIVKPADPERVNRGVMTAATGGRNIVRCAVKPCALLQLTTWSHGLLFPPDIMSDEPDLIPNTWPTQSCCSTPARGFSLFVELPWQCDLFHLISFCHSDTGSFYIILSVFQCWWAAAGGVQDATTLLIVDLTASQSLEINLFYRFLCCHGSEVWNVQFNIMLYSILNLSYDDHTLASCWLEKAAAQSFVISESWRLMSAWIHGFLCCYCSNFNLNVATCTTSYMEITVMSLVVC